MIEVIELIELVATIASWVAVGAVVTCVVSITLPWLKTKLKEIFTKPNVKKVAIADLHTLISECDNSVSLRDLDKMVSNGCTHMMANIDYNGNIVGEVECMQDKNKCIDRDIDELINRTNQGMVIIER